MCFIHSSQFCFYINNSCTAVLFVECRFTYNSNRSLSGYFTSPNFPGYYPRFTECHYKFIGQNHKVRIKFVEYELGSRYSTHKFLIMLLPGYIDVHLSADQVFRGDNHQF